MDLEFKRKIEERMSEIPGPLAQAIRNSGWEGIVFDIGRKYSLHVDDIGSIQNELILVLTGITHPDEFRNILTREIGIQGSKADLIIEEINNKINDKIKDFLKKHLSEQEKVEKEEIIEIENEKLDEIKNSEKKVLQGAGIRLGGDVEEVDSVPSLDDEEEVEVKISVTPNKQNVVVNSEPSIPDIRSKLENPQVFKGKSTAYLDPYREPIE